jgi:hypothetical protein
MAGRPWNGRPAGLPDIEKHLTARAVAADMGKWDFSINVRFGTLI